MSDHLDGPRRSSPDNKETMENSTIVLPTLKDGVVGLGDLWDCRSASSVGNLFEGPLRREHLQAFPVSALTYDLKRMKNARDYTSEFFVSVELALEAAGGQVKIKGKASFERDDTQNFHRETILCSYDLSTFDVRLQAAAFSTESTPPPEGGEPVVSRTVLERLNSGELEATHYVDSVSLGGQAQASITYFKNIDESNLHLTGSLEGTITIGPVTATAKASLELLDKEFSNEYNTQITIKAQPGIDTAPTNCEAMFKVIEGIDKVVEKEKHFPQLTRPPAGSDRGSEVIGVPLRFRLLPISRIPGVISKDGTYKLLEKEMLESFSEMIFTLEDYRHPEYLKTLLWAEVPAIVPILQDEGHPLTADLQKYANAVALKAENLRREALQVFADYKYGKASDVEILEVLAKYNTEVPLAEITAKVMEFGLRGRRELADIRIGDISGLQGAGGRPTVKFFTNAEDLEEWRSQLKTHKLLLTTGNQSTGSYTANGVFIKLFAMSGLLQEATAGPVEVGVAFPGISPDFSLTLQTSVETLKIPPERIHFALDLFRLATDTSPGEIFGLFFSLLAELSGVQSPLSTSGVLHEFPRFLRLMETYLSTGSNVNICESYVDLLARLGGTLDSWNFVVPLVGVDRGVDMMRAFRYLRGALLSTSVPIKHSWYFSKFNVPSSCSSPPLLFVFRDDVLQGMCFDMFDLATLLHCLGGKEGHNWDVIGYSQANRASTIHVDEWNFAVQVIPQVVLEQFTFLSDPLSPHDAFRPNSSPELQEALEVLRALAVRKDDEVLTTLANLALPTFGVELENLLVEFCGWRGDAAFPATRKALKDIEWATFAERARFLMRTNSATYLVQVASVLEDLQRFKNSKPVGEDVDDSEGDDEDGEGEGEDGENGDGKDGEDGEDGENGLDQNEKNRRGNEEIDKRIAFILADDLPDELRRLRRVVKKYPKTEKDGNGVSVPTSWMIRIENIIAALQAFLIDGGKNEEFFHLLQLTESAKRMGTNGDIRSDSRPLASAYVDRVSWAEDDYPFVREILQDALQQEQLLKGLSTLASLRVHPSLFILREEFQKIRSLPSPSGATSLLEKLQKFTPEQFELIWGNVGFLHLLRTSLDEVRVIDSIYALLESQGVSTLEKVPHFIPQDIVQRMKHLFSREVSPGPPFPWLREWQGDVLKFVEQLKTFVGRGSVPEDFQTVLESNLKESTTFREELKRCECLFYFDEVTGTFSHSWTLFAVKEALQRLKIIWEVGSKETGILKKIPSGNIPAATEEMKKSSREDPKKDEVKEVPGINESLEESLKVIERWNPFVSNGELKVTGHSKLTRVGGTSPVPQKLSYGHLTSFCDLSLPFLLENLFRLRDPSLLTSPGFLADLVHYPIPGYSPGNLDKPSNSPSTSLGLIFTRDDFFTAVVNQGDSRVIHKILQLLLQQKNSSVAIPLVVQNISAGQEDKVIFLEKFLEVCVAWESSGILRSHFFSVPHKFVLTLRVGSPPEESLQLPGRSWLLNRHLLQNPETFNSRSNTSSFFGESLSRQGSVEVIPIREVVCKGPFFWAEVMSKVGGSFGGHLLLGILHGDALAVPREVYEALMPLVSCVVVFWNASHWKDLQQRQRSLATLLPFKKSLDVVLYPEKTIVDNVRDENLIYSGASGANVDFVNGIKLSRIIATAFAFSVPKASAAILPPPAEAKTKTSTEKSSKVTTAEDIPVTRESSEFISFVQKESLIKVKTAIVQFVEEEEASRLLEEVVHRFQRVLEVPDEEKRAVALHHIHFELEKMSEEGSAEIREKLTNLREQISTSLDISLQSQVKNLENNLQLRLLTLQTLLHATGVFVRHFELPATVSKFSRTLAEVVGRGEAPLELEDSMKPNFLPILLEAAEEETPLHPPKIFVLSIVGLKNSGKSRLLNELFGGGVSGGFSEFSSTSGIVLRVFQVKQELRFQWDVDVVVVLDCEGTSSPESKWDSPGLQRERKLLAFLFSVSDLTLLHFKGEEVTGQFPEILESSLLMTLCLKKSLTSEQLPIQRPNIHVVLQDEDEEGRDSSRVVSRLESSLEAVRNFAQQRSLDSGLSHRDSTRLVQVFSRFLEGSDSYVHRLPSGLQKREEAVGQLRSFIEDACASSRSNQVGSRTCLGEWLQNCPVTWESLEKILHMENSAATAAKEVGTFETLMELKLAISRTFTAHKERIEGEFVKLKEAGENEDIPAAKTLLESVSEQLIRVPNTCTHKKNVTGKNKRKTRVTSEGGGEEACDECAAVLLLHSKTSSDLEVLEKSGGRNTKTFFVYEDILLHTYSVRHKTFQLFQKSLLQNSTTILQPNPLEEFFAEIQLVYRHLEAPILGRQSLEPFFRREQDEIHLEEEVTEGSLLYSESSYRLNQWKEELSWEEEAWLEVELEDLPFVLLEEFGVEDKSYRWGMGWRLSSRVEHLLRLWAEKFGRKEWSNDFRWSLHAVGMAKFLETLQTPSEASSTFD